MVSYVLYVTKIVEYLEPFIYHEVVTSSESIQWVIVMNEEIKCLHKNQIREPVKPSMKKEDCWLQIGLQEKTRNSKY